MPWLGWGGVRGPPLLRGGPQGVPRRRPSTGAPRSPSWTPTAVPRQLDRPEGSLDPKVHKTTPKYPKVPKSIPKTTQKYTKLPQTTQKYPKVYPKLPQSTQNYPKVHKTTPNYPKVYLGRLAADLGASALAEGLPADPLELRGPPRTPRCRSDFLPSYVNCSWAKFFCGESGTLTGWTPPVGSADPRKIDGAAWWRRPVLQRT